MVDSAHPHQAALDILSGAFAGLALFRTQLRELEAAAPGRYSPEALASLRAHCAALESSVAALRSAPTRDRAFDRLCELLDRVVWRVEQAGTTCRLCGGTKPLHRPACDVEKWINERKGM